MEENIGTVVKNAPKVVEEQVTLPERIVVCGGDSENVPMHKQTDRQSAADRLNAAGVTVASYDGHYAPGVVEKFYGITGF